MKDRYAQIDMATQRARAARRVFPCAPRGGRERVPVAIVGAGPVGLAAAVDLTERGIACVVLDKVNTLSDGSRAICWAKRSLEICDRLGVAGPMMDKGITWNVGRVYCGDDPRPLYSFDLLPDRQQKFPAFINLQQYCAEEYLIDRLLARGGEIRWQHEVRDLRQSADGVMLGVHTPAGDYTLRCEYVIAADGCRSGLRTGMGLDFDGRTFEDNFLIVDLRMQAPFPAERRFWFKAPFNEGRTALMHQQPDGLWRLDFQLGRDIDREQAIREENVSPRVRAMLGPDIDFEYEWISLYTFQCRRMQRFVHERVVFAGDAAHLVSPFGARGANGGLQDVDNLGWKLARVLRGESGPALLASYDEERRFGADENIANSTRATDFMTPKTVVERAFRDAVLELAAGHAFARAFVNSGRLSVPCSLRGSSLTTPDREAFDAVLAPGEVCVDAPVQRDGRPGWLLESLRGDFACLYFGGPGALGRGPLAAQLPPGVALVYVGQEAGPAVDLVDLGGGLARRYGAAPGTIYLVRPDQHVAARWKAFDPAALRSAHARACAVRA
ncbi:MAG TPA: FAD-dependent oxidoreductase [Gammaproteobacteria bacterium]|nr:FAD-dependent oxidoreductase [Gammaproteobacteria bacterium]